MRTQGIVILTVNHGCLVCEPAPSATVSMVQRIVKEASYIVNSLACPAKNWSTQGPVVSTSAWASVSHLLFSPHFIGLLNNKI